MSLFTETMSVLTQMMSPLRVTTSFVWQMMSAFFAPMSSFG
jgi:hypothetical protein